MSEHNPFPADAGHQVAEEIAASISDDQPEQMSDPAWVAQFDPQQAFSSEGASEQQEALLIAAEIERDLDQLRRGDAVAEIADDTDARVAGIERLKAEHPAIVTGEATDAMKPIFDSVVARYAEQYGVETAREMATDPDVLRQIYDQAGGDAAFGGALFEQRYVDQIFGGLDGPRDPFTT